MFIEVSWDEVNAADEYLVYRSEGTTPPDTSLALATTTSFQDVTAAPGIKYNYWVKSQTSSGLTSDYSSYDEGHLGLPAPGIVAASDGRFTDHVLVNWDSVAGAAQYLVYRSEGATPPDSHLALVTSTSYQDTTATPGIKYNYWVKSYVMSNQIISGYSSPDEGYIGLPAPVNLTASDGTSTDSVLLNWNAVTHATGYLVYRAESTTPPDTALAEAASTSYQDTTAVPGIKYNYWVKSQVSSSGVASDYSAYDEGHRGLLPPSNLIASDGTFADRVSVSWLPAAGATQYLIYRAENSTPPDTPLDAADEMMYQDISAVPEVRYYYWVKSRASSSGAVSDYSAYDDGYRALPPPENVDASDATSTQHITITWSSAPAADRYYLYRSTTTTPPATSLIDVDTTSYDDTAAEPGVRYYYWVRSYSSAADAYSDYSPYDDGYLKLAAPTGVSASDGTGLGPVSITWNPVLGAEGYEIYKSQSPNGPYTSIGTSDLTIFDEPATDCETSYYNVRAYSALAGYSDESAEDAGYGFCFTLTILFEGTGSGTVTADPQSHSCTADCQLLYPPDTSVTLHQIPGPDVEYYAWIRGGCYGSMGEDCTIPMTHDRSITALFLAPTNYMFVTSQTFIPGVDFSGISEADAICAQLAQAAGLPANTYVAWLSDDSTDARDRLTGARGWMRVDELPFADQVSDLLAGRIYYPPRIDEFGIDLGSRQDVFTGTDFTGTLSTHTCLNWTDGTAGNRGVAGHTTSTTDRWSRYGTPSCNIPARLYCFGTDYSAPVEIDQQTGPIAFVTQGFYTPQEGGDVSYFDSACQSEADAAGLGGTFLALVASDGLSAVDRFSPFGPAWVRVDGVPIVPTAADLFSSELLQAPINVVADGSEYSVCFAVWSGANRHTDPPQLNCSDWSTTSSTGRFGGATYTCDRSFNFTSVDCTYDALLYCLEDNNTNIMFTTSTAYWPGVEPALGGFRSLAEADAICAAHAQAAGLPGDPNLYLAWLSTDLPPVNAKDRVGTGGWIRTDGLPLADSLDDLLAGRLYYPPRIDENGNDVGAAVYSATGTGSDGTSSGATCDDWTSAGARIMVGESGATTRRWTDRGGTPCDRTFRLMCFGTHYSSTPFKPTGEARKAFLTQQPFVPQPDGIAAADALCRFEAEAAGLTGTFLALLATEGQSAASRFDTRGPRWVRVDGAAIAPTAAALFSTPTLATTLNLTADGTYYSDGDIAWTGATSTQFTGALSTCDNWTQTTGLGRVGYTVYTSTGWFSLTDGNCETTYAKLYCLEQ